jgi:L-Ala-D/L-Glu epimerase
MRIAELTLFSVCVPLRRELRHASAARSQSENLIARCRLADGVEGWGEGVPREYVTGESVAGAFAQLAATDVAKQLDADCQNWEDAIRLCDGLRLAEMREDPRQCYGNALRAAIELSILDAFGRLLGEPLSAVTHCYEPARDVRASHARVRYSTTITVERPAAERLSALKMRLYGFAQCKVKVGAPGSNDPQRLARIRRWIGAGVDLRLDANEAWHTGELVAKMEPLLKYNVSCLEQPLPHTELESFGELRPRLSTPIMLDESLTSEADAREAIRLRACDLLNIRLSKCGGFLSSLRLAAIARRAGLGYQLGCHPGETGILSAAGRHWAASVRDIRYLEGSYDRHILRELLTNEDLTFGYGGRAPALSRPGLGVTINQAVLERWTRRQETYRL